MLTCESCGAKNPEGTAFCSECGAYQSWEGGSTSEAGVRTSAAGSGSGGQADAATAPDDRPGGVPAGAGTDGTAQREGNQDDTADRALREPIDPTLFRSGATPEASMVTTVLPAVAASPAAPVTSQGAYVSTEPRQCPVCRRINAPTLRFCSKCGQSLVPETKGSRVAPTKKPRWWARRFDSKDRAARRAYRHSLPLLYRWRRVIIAVVVVAALFGLSVAVGRDPKGFVVDRYHDLRRTVVNLPDVQAAVVPPGATLRGTSPAALVDRTEAAWTMRWRPQTQEGDSCAGAPGTGVVVLTVPPTRVREIVIRPGLPAEDEDRLLQARPRSIGISFDGAVCRRFVLPNLPDRQELRVDSEVEVTSIRIGVDTVYPPGPGGVAALSFTEISVKARPQT